MRGKNTFRRIFNKKNIIISMFLLVIVILSRIGVTTNYNNGIKTNIDKYNDTEVSKMGITSEDIIKKAIELANQTGNYYQSGCIGFVNQTINEIQGNTDLINQCSGWQNSTINGISVQNAIVTETKSVMNGTPWYRYIRGLTPGDIIVGDGHAMIFLGETNNDGAVGYEELKKMLSDNYGITLTSSIPDYTTIGDCFTGSYYRARSTTQAGCKYWTIDVNGGQGGVGRARIQNYDWTDTSGSAYSSNLNNMIVYRFKKNITGQYHLNIAKRSTEDNSALANKTGINGVNIKVTNTTNNETNTRTTGKINDNCYGMIEKFFKDTTITKDNVNTPDIYTIEETNTVSGYEKLDLSNIRIAVYKKVSSDNSKYIVDYVRINNASGNELARATNNKGSSNGECKLDINGDGLYDIGLEVYSDGSGLCVTLRNKPEGKYHINIVKKATWDTETDKKDKNSRYQYALGGANFKITQNAKNVGVNVGKNSNENLTSVEGKISTIAFANKGSDSDGNITINESNKNTPDEYEIIETKSPDGYQSLGKTLKFKVYKTNDYKIKGITVGNSDKLWEYTGANMDYGGTVWVRIDKDGNVIDKNATNKEDYVIALDFNQTAITITYKDPPEGSYNLNIAKKPSDSISENKYSDCIGGAEFVVKQNRNGGTGTYNVGVSRKTEDNDESAFDHDPDDVVSVENRIVRTVSGDLTKKIAFGNHGSSYLGDIKVNEDNCDTEDIYTFKETKAPLGYINEFIGLKIGITKKYDSNKKTYVIDKIKYYGIKYNVPKDKNDDSWADDLTTVKKEITANGNIQWLKIGKDGSVVTDDNDCIISLDFHQTAVTVTYKDNKAEGIYDVSLAKLNSDDVEKMTSAKDYDSLKNVSGIKFNVMQITPDAKTYRNTVETKSEPISITNERKYSKYYKKWCKLWNISYRRVY